MGATDRGAALASRAGIGEEGIPCSRQGAGAWAGVTTEERGCGLQRLQQQACNSATARMEPATKVSNGRAGQRASGNESRRKSEGQAAAVRRVG
jgi:hypothetical protein